VAQRSPHRNVGRAIIWSIAICVVVYLLVAFAVGSSLPLDRIVAAKDYALAEAAQPALGQITDTGALLDDTLHAFNEKVEASQCVVIGSFAPSQPNRPILLLQGSCERLVAAILD